MRRIFITLIALFTISTTNAQGWLDALKKVATEAVDKATDGALTKIAIVGSWSYSAPAIKLDGEDTLTSLSGSALSATLGSKMESIFAKVGIVEGSCSVTFNEDGTFTMPIKSRNISGTYTYNNEDHSLTMTLGQEKKVEVKGFAYISGANLQLVFQINKLTDFLVNVGSSVSSLSTVTNLIKQYENIYLGFEFARQTATTTAE